MKSRLLFVLLFAGSVLADEVAMTDGAASAGHILMIGDKRRWDMPVGSEAATSATGYLSVEPGDGELAATWNGKGEGQLFLARKAPGDFSQLLADDAALVLELKVDQAPKRKTVIKMSCGYPCLANADITKLLKAIPQGEWLRVSFDLKCFADGGLDVTRVDAPFLLTTAGKLSLSLADVRLVPGAGPSAVINCR